MSYIIAGLGNPDPEYTGTRHSLGRAVVQQLARSSGLGTKNKLVTPDNYMNNSGVALKLLVKNAKQAERLVAVYDDLDLPVGALKISFNKSSGGHKGLESVIKQLKTKGLKPEAFKWYIDAFRYGAPMHAGWSIGLERLTQTMLGLPNIREATLFPRDRHRLTP